MEMQLTAAAETYTPRACDCDFCRKHGAAYVSDAKGALLLRMKNAGDRGAYRQGSGQAEFVLCRNCGVLVGVMCLGEGRLYGAVNVRAVDGAVRFADEQTVSPQKLSADAKAERWQQVWFANVDIREEAATAGGETSVGGAGLTGHGA